MIVHLNGDYETVDYVPNRSVLLYDNNEDEEYPLHWHNAIEIIMPLTNGFEAVCAGKNYKLSERDILIIPGHSSQSESTVGQKDHLPVRQQFLGGKPRTVRALFCPFRACAHKFGL